VDTKALVKAIGTLPVAGDSPCPDLEKMFKPK